MKKLFTFFLALLTGVGTIFAESGKCGPNLTWDLTDGVLTISGTGAMDDYSQINAPWYSSQSSIKSVLINEGVTSIGESAFAGYSGLSSVTIPESVTSIGEFAFAWCISLAVHISNLAAWCKISYPIGSGYNLYLNGNLITDLVIPNSVTSIGEGTFSNCNSLTSVTIPNSVTSIGERTFSNCNSLTSVSIPNSVTSIGENTFSWCSSLTSVMIPNSVTSIGEHAFESCNSLTSVTIGNSVTSIGDWAFFNTGNSPSSFVFFTTVPPTIGTYTFDFSNEIYYVPCGTKEDYISAWKTFVNLSSELINYLPAPEISVSFDANSGNVEKNVEGTICDATATITAEAKTGYHFVQWNDGNNENPRTITLTQDTSFTAEFAKNRYSITAVPNDVYQGSVTGGGVAEYLDQMTLTAVPQTGYHFNYWENKSSKYYDNPLTVTAREDATFTAYFALTIYNITTKADLTQGRVTAPAQSTFIEPVTMTAVPNTGYEFVQWNDGNTDNPRIVVLTQDTTFTAEFAKSKYTIITKPDNESHGTTNGNIVAEYMEKVTMTAEALYGYHFDYWEAGENKYYENPLTITVKGDTTYTAVYAPNVYSIVTKADASEGTVTVPAQANYLEEVTITAIPNNGYEFVQWNDGNTDNPRTVVLTQDTTFTALFEPVVSGTCGENNALTWYYDREKAELSITGKGKLNSNFAYGIEAPENAICLVVGEDVTIVSSEAFKEFSKLQTVTWNATNCEIAGTPFQNTITTMIFGEKVDKVPSYICNKLSNLNSVTIPNSVINIGSNAFSGCTGLTKITIPTSVNAIGNNAFMGCDNITSVVWNAKNCNRYKFGAQVESFVFGNEVEIIPAGICSGMNKLPTMTIPNSVTSIGDQAFSRCSGLTSMKIGNSVTSIGYYAFEGCSGLTSMTIPNSVTSIGDWAFDGCSGLTSITIPKSVTSIGDVPFLLCSNLKTIDIDADNPNYSSERGVLFNKDKTTLIQCPGGKQGTFAIPNAVTSIGNYAFSACSDLTSVTIPNSVTNIGDVAFSGCSSLTSIEIPNSVTNIGESAFVGCAGLTSVVIGNGVKEIRDGAFIYCPLKSITIGTGLRKISSNAFLNIEMNAYDKYGQPEPKWDATGNFIYTVEKVVCYAKVPPTIELSGASDYKEFLDNFAETVIYVPQESVSRYQAYIETWGRLDIRPIKAATADATSLTVTPSASSAEITWPQVSGAASYELVIKDKFGNVVYTLIFNAQGQLTSIAFAAPSRDGAPQRTQIAGFSFTITGLDSGSSYDLTMISKDQNGDTIDEKQLSFSTSGNAPTAIDAIEGPMHGGSSKLLRNGQVLIRRGDKLYTMQGQEVE